MLVGLNEVPFSRPKSGNVGENDFYMFTDEGKTSRYVVIYKSAVLLDCLTK